MKSTPLSHVFKKAEAKPASTDILFKAMPSWWVVLFAYALAALFCVGIHHFFLWFPPYLYEVFKNLRGLPEAWANVGLFWGERGLTVIAIVAAIYHHLWQIGTRYRLSTHNIRIENWFPVHRVITIPYGAVRRAGYQQSFLGLILNYGHIEIDTASPTPLVLLNCPHPTQFLKTLEPKVEQVLQPSLTHHKRATDL